MLISKNMQISITMLILCFSLQGMPKPPGDGVQRNLRVQGNRAGYVEFIPFQCQQNYDHL